MIPLLWACVLSMGPVGSSTAAVLLQDAGAYDTRRIPAASRAGHPSHGTSVRHAYARERRTSALLLWAARSPRARSLPSSKGLRHPGWATLGCKACRGC